MRESAFPTHHTKITLRASYFIRTSKDSLKLGENLHEIHIFS
jgi:hypothetical protein